VASNSNAIIMLNIFFVPIFNYFDYRTQPPTVKIISDFFKNILATKTARIIMGKMAKSGRTLWTQAIKEGKTASSKDGASAWTSKTATAGAEKRRLETERNLKGRQIRGIVLGIDPSLRGTGLAIIESRADGSLAYVESLTVKNHPSLSMPECLAKILKETSAIIKRNNPVCVAIEQSVYVQNFRTALILGSSRGAAIAAAASFNLEVFEYPPLRIKQAVIGYGRASKEQVARSVAGIVAGSPLLPSDEADAAGAAITHIFTHKI